jgi:TetR/AcrR family transcriptional regulator, cholesterol catabolism regulator
LPPATSAVAGTRESRPSQRRILESAARLISTKGYEGTSIQDIAEACGLTKAGLYHHIRSKEQLLLAIMDHGMDVFEEQVLEPARAIADPIARLRACMERNLLLVTRGLSKEVTIVLHEHDTLTGPARSHINGRKKRYVRFLEESFAEAVRRGQIRPVNPKVAAFVFLGTVLWTYKWYRPDGPLDERELARQMQNMFFGGLERAGAARPVRTRKER